jgi:hypothetical protein
MTGTCATADVPVSNKAETAIMAAKLNFDIFLHMLQSPVVGKAFRGTVEVQASASQRTSFRVASRPWGGISNRNKSQFSYQTVIYSTRLG